ncbi:uncharacterized protein LOC130641046 [Hydractinia symbiolongicarpus]|uniref:uncharacterized protein LOC130641046 n=1 Tax=Hydractinia symbiolongicarpus TaxID=13093 RepID=UPI00254D0249|nr:uncharacterized protein LOC130641046 [Hydractinia symbiolongicarpus]
MKIMFLNYLLGILFVSHLSFGKMIKARLHRGINDYFSSNETLDCKYYSTHTKHKGNCLCNPYQSFYANKDGVFRCYEGIGWNLGCKWTFSPPTNGIKLMSGAGNLGHLNITCHRKSRLRATVYEQWASSKWKNAVNISITHHKNFGWKVQTSTPEYLKGRLFKVVINGCERAPEASGCVLFKISGSIPWLLPNYPYTTKEPMKTAESKITTVPLTTKKVTTIKKLSSSTLKTEENAFTENDKKSKTGVVAIILMCVALIIILVVGVLVWRKYSGKLKKLCKPRQLPVDNENDNRNVYASMANDTIDNLYVTIDSNPETKQRNLYSDSSCDAPYETPVITTGAIYTPLDRATSEPLYFECEKEYADVANLTEDPIYFETEPES